MPNTRIIFIPFIDAFGGVERLAIDLAGFLHQQGAPATIVCFRQTIDLQSYADFPLGVQQLLPARNSVVEARALSRFLRSNQREGNSIPLLFDLKSAFYSGLSSSGAFILHLTDPPSLLPSDLSKHSRSARQTVAEFAGLPSAGALRSSRAELVHRLNRRGVQRAVKVIVMTEKIRRELQQLYGVDAIIIRPGVSSDGPQRPPSPGHGEPFRLLSVSRLEPNKRIDWILRALETLNANGALGKTDWTFEVVGQGPADKSLKHLAEHLGLAERVSFLGHLAGDALAAAYARANLFVMPAVQGYGLPALEALQRRIPTIVHQESGVSEVLGDSPWVEIVNGENGSLARAIEKMKNHLATGQLVESNLPSVPTASAWATEISSACGWLNATAAAPAGN